MKKLILSLIFLSSFSALADIKVSVKIADIIGRLDDQEILANLDKAISQELDKNITLDRSDIKRFSDEAEAVVKVVRNQDSLTGDEEQALWSALRVSLTAPNLKTVVSSKKEKFLYGFLRKVGPHNFELVLSNNSRYFISGWQFQKK